ncbi:MAG: CAP domain-containing protein [Agitococcus sp.]|nr:CAP domain-containing protein [Agitococcus sp.]MDO9179559.1 CAP domain-containing protein [Agitococcus sp.]
MKTKLNLMAIAIMLAVSACGGGSGSGAVSVPATPPVATTPGITPANLQTNVPAPTYVAGSTELISYTELNGFRRMMGLGPVAQDTKMDVGAKNHSAYCALNQEITHIESAAKSGFTGVSFSDRLIVAQYAGTPVLELIGVGYEKMGVDGMMNTLYHRDGLTAQSVTHVGISYTAGWSYPVVMDFGQVGLGQNNASDFSTTYPVANQTDLPLTMSPELPNPFSDLVPSYDVFAKNTSSPISVYSEAKTTLTVATFTVAEKGQTTPLDVRLLTSKNDVNGFIAKNVAHIVGRVPFKANTTYNVSFNGNVNGVTLMKNWSFTTGTSLLYGGGANLPK